MATNHRYTHSMNTAKFPTVASAHGGREHAIGTVTKGCPQLNHHRWGGQTMKNFLLIGLPIALLMSGLAIAQSDFDGTWRIDLNKAQMPDKPDVFLLQGGNYQCKTCVPAINVKADGEDHSVTGNPSYDTINVKILGDQGIEKIQKQKGRAVATSRMTVSPDGATATVESTDTSSTNSDPVTYKEIATRLGKAKRPAGAHAISGSWRTSKIESISDNGLMFTFKVDGDILNMAMPAGRSYSAKLDGTDAPYKGNSVVNGVSVMRLGKATIEETDKHDGKAVKVTRLMVDPADTKTMEMIVTDRLRGTTTVFVAHKQ
jgi:hypothetical protein